jgi:phage host-nuclease inhibitor protein Gam
MTTTPFPTLAPTPASTAIQTRQQLETVLENIAALRREHTDLQLAQENELAAVRHKYRSQLAELETFLDLETSWVETWAHAHPEAFATAGRAIVSEHATIGFRAAPPRLERASRRWNWSRIAHTLAAVPWGRRYLRLPAPEVDRDLLLADLPRLSLADLRATGIRVQQGDQFYLTHPEHLPLQEAA